MLLSFTLSLFLPAFLNHPFYMRAQAIDTGKTKDLLSYQKEITFSDVKQCLWEKNNPLS